MDGEKMRIAIPNKGALSKPALEILERAGFASLDSPEDALLARCEDSRVEYLFVRAQDIPKYVDCGAVYAGVTGEDMLAECGSGARRVLDLDFGQCEIALAVPEGSGISSVSELEGKRIATKLPNISRGFLSKAGIKAEIFELSGATEIAPAAGLSDAIIDHVQTGRTLRANRLNKIETISRSSAYLVAGKTSAKEEEILEEISLSISGVLGARNLKYFLLNVYSDSALSLVLRVLPSLESPTILNLGKEGEYAVHTVVDSEIIPKVIRDVKLAGGKDILVMPLEKVIA